MLEQADIYKNFAQQNNNIVDYQSEKDDTKSFHFSQLNSSEYNDTEYKYEQRLKQQRQYQYNYDEDNNQFDINSQYTYESEFYQKNNYNRINRNNQDKNSDISSQYYNQKGIVKDKKHNRYIIPPAKDYYPLKNEGIEIVTHEKRMKMIQKDQNEPKVYEKKKDYSNYARIIQRFILAQKKPVLIHNLILYMKGKSERENTDYKLFILQEMQRYSNIQVQKIEDEEDTEDEEIKKQIFQLQNFSKLAKNIYEEENQKHQKKQSYIKSREEKLYTRAEQIFTILNRKKHIKRELKVAFVEVFKYPPVKKEDKEIILNLMIKMIHDKIQEMYDDELKDPTILQIDKRKYMDLKEHTEEVLNEEYKPKDHKITAVQTVEFDKVFNLFSCQGYTIQVLIDLIFQLIKNQFISKYGLKLYLKKKILYQRIDYTDKSLDDPKIIPKIKTKPMQLDENQDQEKIKKQNDNEDFPEDEEEEDEDQEENSEEELDEDQKQLLQKLTIKEKFEFKYEETYIDVQSYNFKVDVWEQGGKLLYKQPFKSQEENMGIKYAKDKFGIQKDNLQKQYKIGQYNENNKNMQTSLGEDIKDQEDYKDQNNINNGEEQEQQQNKSNNVDNIEQEDQENESQIDSQNQKQLNNNSNVSKIESQTSYISNTANELQNAIGGIEFTNKNLQSKKRLKNKLKK